MSWVEQTIFGVRDKVGISIERLKTFEPPEGYWLAFSGGKDSICIYQLAKMAGVKFDAHYAVTGLDHPELVRFIKREYPQVEFMRPEKTMWQLIPEHLMPPTRIVRYCCEDLKERGGAGRLVMTGIRASESAKRARRGMNEVCLKDRTKRYLHVIIDWQDEDVWEFIKSNGFAYPKLYDDGYKRLGCIGCPMHPISQKQDLEKYPKFKNLYLLAFSRMLNERRRKSKPTQWNTPEEVMEWWLSNKRSIKKEDDGTPCLFGFGELADDEHDGDSKRP
jgi:phosphoadenosine phosphosulfate reductase